MATRFPRPSLSKKSFLDIVKAGAVPPLSIELPYGSPATVYAAFQGPMSFLLESVKGPFTIARYSFIGVDPYAIYTVKDGSATLQRGKNVSPCPGRPLSTLRNLLGRYEQQADPRLPPFQGGAAGLLSYDFVRYLENVPATADDDLAIPDAHVLMIDRLISFDHEVRKAWAVVSPGARSDAALDWETLFDEAEHALSKMAERASRSPSLPVRPLGKPIEIRHDMSEKYYTDIVGRAKEYIAAGDIFQANLSLRVSAFLHEAPPWSLYTALRTINPSPFAAYLDMGDYQLVSSSPERLVRVSGSVVETRPIAGTRPRGRDGAEDTRLSAELLLNEKERAEHIMLIDLERNDIGRVCEYGSVHVDEFMITEAYSHVIHIVSNVKGKLAKGKTSIDVIRAAFPGGTITGVPKVRCMEIIDELEPLKRGPYTGSIGYVGFSGCMDLNIVIRTMTVKNGTAFVQAGAGIVADSDPRREYRESLKKAEALVKTLDMISARGA
jgi:aminodeoxychorismate synthase component I